MKNLDVKRDQLRTIKKILQKYVPRHAVWAYGSRIEGTAEPDSGLDLAVITDEQLPKPVHDDLTAAFLKANLPWKVKIIDWQKATHNDRQKITSHYVVIKESRKEKIQRFLSAIPFVILCLAIFLSGSDNRKFFNIPDYMVAFSLGCLATILYEIATYPLRKYLTSNSTPYYKTLDYKTALLMFLLPITAWILISFKPEILGLSTTSKWLICNVELSSWGVIFAIGAISTKECYDWIMQ